jgi:hypothetical protein
MMNTSFRQNKGIGSLLKGVTLKRGMIWGIIIIFALLAFEIFNYSTTQFALADILGNLKFAGISWATMLALAFCGIDFAGIARLFTPEQGRDEPAEIWYLFGAWLLAAAFNALLTWWGVKVAIATHQSEASGVIMEANAFNTWVPIFVAIMVWLIRVLIIGSFSIAGDRLFSVAQRDLPRRPDLQPTSPLTGARPVQSPFHPVASSQIARPDHPGDLMHHQ